MKHFLRKIDPAGLFIEDCFFDDGAYEARPGVPKMTAGKPAVPASPEAPAQAATDGVQLFVGGLPATDEAGNPVWATPPRAAVPAVPAVAAVPEVLPVQEVDAKGNPVWITAPVPAYAGDPIPADMIATPAPGGMYHPRWTGKAWVEGKDPAYVQAREAAKAADKLAAAADESIAAKAKLNTTIRFLATHTDAEIADRMQADITNLAGAKNMITQLAIAVGAMARRQLK